MRPRMLRVFVLAVFIPLAAHTQPTSTPATSAPAPYVSPPPGMVTVACKYPQSARSADAKGVTVLSVHLMRDGVVQQADVVKSSGNADLDGAAIQCLNVARFNPVTQEGKPVEVTWQRQVVWDPHGRSSITVPKTAGSASCISPQFRTHGKVVTAVSFHIAPDGSTRDIMIIESSGNSSLDEVATKCMVPAWRYPAALQDGKPIEIDWSAGVDWKL